MRRRPLFSVSPKRGEILQPRSEREAQVWDLNARDRFKAPSGARQMQFASYFANVRERSMRVPALQAFSFFSVANQGLRKVPRQAVESVPFRAGKRLDGDAGRRTGVDGSIRVLTLEGSQRVAWVITHGLSALIVFKPRMGRQSLAIVARRFCVAPFGAW
jgi:hypothetical protein